MSDQPRPNILVCPVVMPGQLPIAGSTTMRCTVDGCGARVWVTPVGRAGLAADPELDVVCNACVYFGRVPAPDGYTILPGAEAEVDAEALRRRAGARGLN